MQHLPENLAAALFSFGASRILRIRRPHILVACMPKSASTYLTSALANIEGLKRTSITLSMMQREQEIDPVRAAMRSLGGYVAQHHVRFSRDTDDLMRTFDITPVVLVRDLPDVIVSLRDHIRKRPEMSMSWFTRDHAKLSDLELEMAIVSLAMPWYINFYVSWHSCPRALWVTYADATERTAETIEAICGHAGIPVTDSDVDAAIAEAGKQFTRLNVGKAGRGSSLTREAMDSLRHLCSFYPEIDFRKVGIDLSPRREPAAA